MSSTQPRRVRPGHRADVEGLRAIAVGLVVAYHAGVPFVTGGFIGVDVFFVLSGFLITGLLADELTREGRLSFARFYGRRARRLLPMSTVVLVATAIAFSFVISPLDRVTLAADIRSAALYVANWHFAVASFDYLGNPSKSPVLHYWSLGVEEQFYVVWPLLLYVVGRRAARRQGAAAATRRMATALALLAVGSLVLCVVTTASAAPYAYYGLHTRAWELAAGGLLALGAGRVSRLPSAVRVGAGFAGLATIVGSAVVIGADTAFPGWAALGPVVGTVLVVAAGGVGPPAGVSRLLATAPFTYVGRISYSWYLWHWPCLLFAGAIASGKDLHAIESFRLPHGGTAAIAVAVSFLLSVGSHHLLEDPVRRSRWLAAVRFRSLALGAALTAVSVTAIALLLPASNGRPSGPVLAEVAPAWPDRPAGATLPAVVRTITLAQTPEQARFDDPNGTRDCYDDYVPSTAASDCLFGDPHGTTTIAMVGDSHMEQWFPGMVRAAELHHWRLWLWAKVACPFIGLQVQLPQFHDTYPSCAPWRQAVLSRLAAIPHLDAIVVSHYGSLISRGGRFAADGHTLTQQQLPAAWHRSWTDLATTLAADASRVVVLRDVPKPSTDIPACLAAHGTDARPCSFSRAFAFARADQLFHAEHDVGVPQERFVDLDDLLCPGDPCPVIAADGTVIYRDAHHLTATISRELGDALGNRLAAVLPR